MNLTISLLLTLAVLLSTGYGSFTSKQICNNCGVGPDCGPPINETEGITRESLCWELCDAVENCTLASLNGSSICRLYNCTQIAQSIGGHTYRRTNLTDCPEYEIFVHKDHTVDCTHIEQPRTVAGEEDCLESCLETHSCRGSVYNSSLSYCSYYDRSCTNIIPSPGDTFFQRKCLDELPACVRNNTQTCINCRAGLLCKMTYNQVVHTKPLQVDTTQIGVDQELEQIWFSYNTTIGSSYMYMQCSYVTQSIGDIVYRASCSQDCLKFELFTLTGYGGTCAILGELTGGVTLEFCMDKCLDMDQCRGVSYDTSSQSCTFHNCDNYTAADGFHFMRRRCIDEPECQPNDMIIQTCVHCKSGPNCPAEYNMQGSITETTNCYNIKASDVESVLVYYRRTNSKCISYQCSQVQQSMGEFVYRLSCNTDCPEFELFQLVGYTGTCDVIGSDEGGLNFEYCIERCLDIHGCRATTFDSLKSRCQFHSCSNYTASTADMYFMWKRCGAYEVQRDYHQTCVDCWKSIVCANAVQTLFVSTWQQCQDYFLNYIGSQQACGFNAVTSTCLLYNCTWVQEHANMHAMIFRKSVTNDCPVYRLIKMNGYEGSGPLIGYEEGTLSLDYCIDKCLDLPGCRAVSYHSNQMYCNFHNSTERSKRWVFKFVKRICMTLTELNPVRPYTQTCKNCQNKCDATLSVENNIYISSVCNTTCDECNSIQYNPQLNSCSQYKCDRPYPLGEGTTLMRRTPNPDCLHFEIFAYSWKTPMCVPFEYDEGVTNAEYCLKRCFDLPGCRMLGMDPVSENCSYFTCSDFDVPNATNQYKYIAVKSCIQDCPVSNVTMQTCLNCDKAYLCQSSFRSLITTADTCNNQCGTYDICEAYTYTSSQLCEGYQCSYVQQVYGSTFFRKACHTDCPVYEIYILNNRVGVCPRMENMTEYLVMYEEICHERCLDTPGCRGVTYSSTELICYYHTCDCHAEFTVLPGYSFMWKYCLQEFGNATVLPSTGNVTELPTLYPVSTDCSSNTTSSSTTSTTTLSTSLSSSSPPTTSSGSSTLSTSPPTPSSDSSTLSTSPSPSSPPTPSTGSSTTQFSRASVYKPIYLLPCLCSSGTFRNMTNEEIIDRLMKNLTLDAESLSSTKRKKSCAKDERISSITIGAVGAIILASVAGVIILSDLLTLLRTLRQTPNNVNQKKQKRTPSTPDNVPHLYAEDLMNTKDVNLELLETHST